MSFIRFRLLLLIFLLTGVRSFAQVYQVSGYVIDAQTREPLAFVNIVVNDSRQGTSTDIDGRFRARSDQKISFLKLSYVGYEPVTYRVGQKTNNIVISMNEKEIELQEVEILPGVNPAHRIIRNAIDNRDLNDPEKLESFSYTSYDKTIFTLSADSSLHNPFSDSVVTISPSDLPPEFMPRMDSLASDSVKMDSVDRVLDNLMKKQYLFLMENVTKRKFLAPDRSYNEVIATKMSGFKDPIFVFLTTQIQSFSFYKPFITIFQQTYVNPIGTGSLSKYFFKLQDTTYMGKDTIYIISFRPRKGTNFTGLEGTISISSNRWAIKNVIAEPYGETGGISIKIQQMYELVDSVHWFPVQLNTDVALKNLRIGKYSAIGSGRYYIRDIVLNPEMVRREFNHLDVEVVPQATERTDDFWNQYRTDSLSNRDKRTYVVLDSIGQANNFDRMAKNFQTLMTGRIPWGPIEFDINKFFDYDYYQGFILGLGLHTSDKVSRRFKVGGYYQYAFAISTSKYGGDISYLVNRRNDVSIRASYSYDLTESGGTRFFDDNESVISGNFRPLLLKLLDRNRNAALSLTFRPAKYLLMNASFSWSHKKTNGYDLATYENGKTLLYDDFIFTEAGAGLKWAYGEKFIQTKDNKISLGTSYPIIWLQYTRGISGFLNGDFDYDRFDLKLEKTFRLKYLGKLTFRLNAGYVDQPIPACNLYNGNGSYREFTVFAPYSFATMRMNEFLSNGYAALYIYHDFEQLLIKGKKWFHPEFAIAQNIGFGFLDHPEQYAWFREDVREMNLGYYESGLLVNNIINLRFYKVGAGAFYRWGPYSMERTGDNFAYKISLIFPLNNFMK